MPHGEIVAVPFHGESILTMDIDGEPYVVLKPAVEAIGLAYWSQVEKLRSRSWACTTHRVVQLPGDRQSREHLLVSVQTFLMLLATVNEKSVAKDVQPKLVAYQAECAQAIQNYWMTGVAVRESNVTVPAPRDPGRYDFLRAMLDQIENAERRAEQAEQIAVESARTSLDTSARLDAIEGRHDWYAALGYAKLHGLPTSHTYLQRLGAEAGRVGRDSGIEANRVQHALYGAVNQWPEWVWDRAVENRRQLSDHS